CALLGLLFAAGAQAEEINDYAYAAPVIIARPAPFQRIELPISVYRVLTHDDLSDLRVFNADGEVVPHALEPRILERSAPGTPVAVPLFMLGAAADSGRALNLRIETDERGAVVSLGQESTRARGPARAWLVDASQIGQRIRALELVVAEHGRQLSGRMRVEASKDLAQWRTLVASAPLVPLHTEEQELARLRIDWPATEARYLRLTWSGAPPEGARERIFEAARVEPVPAAVELPRTWLTLQAPLIRKLGDHDEYMFEIPLALPADRLRITPPQANSVVPVELFVRAHGDAPWQSLGRHQVFRLSETAYERHNPDLPLKPAAELMLRVDARGGGFGTGSPTVEVGWIAHNLVFAARGKPPFTLAYGRHQASNAAFAIDNLVPGYGQDASSALPIATATLGEAVTAGGPDRLRAPLDARRWMLWATLLIAVAVLGAMAWMLPRLKEPTA
ncbi:MAG TPA: DUF3999 domain-containing protein, partial [Pseudothauera hydrothermalis]|nr:DUF3999 domain-containing protein [Pseudothauera hydrothermalis]